MNRRRQAWKHLLMPLLGMVLLLSLAWMVLGSLETSRRRNLREQRLERIASLIPVLRQRGFPAKLAQERLVNLVQPIREVTPATLARLRRDLKREFAGGVGLLGFDTRMQLVACEGFRKYPLSRARADLVLANRFRLTPHSRAPVIMMANFGGEASNIETPPVPRQRRIGPVEPGEVPDWRSAVRRENVISCQEDLVGEVPGVIVQVIVQRVKMGDFRRGATLVEDAVKPEQCYCRGRLLIFVPYRLFRGPTWQRRILRRPVPQLLAQTWTGTREDLLKFEGISREVREEVVRRSYEEYQGFFALNGWNAAFVKYPLNPVMIALGWEPPPPLETFFFRMCKGGAFALAMIVFFLLTALNQGWLDGFRIPLARKFLLISLLIAYFPIVGLGWMFLSQRQWESDRDVTAQYEGMEDSLQKLEALSDQLECDVVSKVRVFIDRFDWTKGIPSAQILIDTFRPLLDSCFETLGILADGGDRVVVDRDPYNRVEIARPDNANLNLLMIDSLLTILGQNARLGSRKSDAQMGVAEVKGQILFDTLKNVLGGVEEILYIGLRQNTLMNFRALKETTWVFMQQVLDSLGKAKTMLFFSINRKELQLRLMNRWIGEDRGFRRSFPTRGCYAISSRESIAVRPLVINHHPLFHYLFQRLAVSGGVQKIALRLNGHQVLCLARPLRNIDYIGVVCRPLSRARVTGWVESGFPWLVCGYPLLVILLLSYFFQDLYVRPIQELQAGVERLARGNFEQPLMIASRDEIGELALSFNRMADGLKEKEYLSRFLSDMAKEAIRRSDRAPATRVKASVLFSDVRGFTTMSEALEPEMIVRMLNHHFTRVEEVVERHEGVIDKFIGDAVMVVFLPLHGRPHPALRALEAGIAMMHSLADLNREREEKGEFAIRIGVGIGTGELLMGVLGRSDGRQDFTVTGSTVNLAAQMEKRTKEGTSSFVVVCAETLRQVEAAGGRRFQQLPAREGYADGFEWQS